ncbi:hypothetical protein BC833DRAFT_582017 [Globomyces pollinis-pini]|nr:hypothetical protein BC833DRAFT_582017 [Globomyces pollinis-pini]
MIDSMFCYFVGVVCGPVSGMEVLILSSLFIFKTLFRTTSYPTTLKYCFFFKNRIFTYTFYKKKSTCSAKIF